MVMDMTEVMIQSIARNSIDKIRIDSKRAIRNAVEMAEQFSKGKFQKQFLQTVQKMLEDEQSAYYELVSKAVSYLKTDTILSFGINLGYHSCTKGAKKIRELEKEKGYSIPWAISMEISNHHMKKSYNRYVSLVDEGEELGVFTWMLWLNELKETLAMVPIIKQHEGSDFFLLCETDNVTDEFIQSVEMLNNIMVVLQWNESSEKICTKLREYQIMYGIYFTYDESDIPSIQDGTLLQKIKETNPLATVFVKKKACKDETGKQVAELIKNIRNEQRYPMLVWEFYEDSCYVDSIISEDRCFVHFDDMGNIQNSKNVKLPESNLFYGTLDSILHSTFPKE